MRQAAQPGSRGTPSTSTTPERDAELGCGLGDGDLAGVDAREDRKTTLRLGLSAPS